MHFLCKSYTSFQSSQQMQGLIETRHLAFECNNLPFSTQISYSRTYYILKILLTFEFCQNVAFETFPQRCIVDLFHRASNYGCGGCKFHWTLVCSIQSAICIACILCSVFLSAPPGACPFLKTKGGEGQSEAINVIVRHPCHRVPFSMIRPTLWLLFPDCWSGQRDRPPRQAPVCPTVPDGRCCWLPPPWDVEHERRAPLGPAPNRPPQNLNKLKVERKRV